MKNQTFTLTADHLKLLQRMYVDFGGSYDGAPYVGGKRPYGNSDVLGDIADILGIEFDSEAEDRFTPEQEEYMMKLHRETGDALQICLLTQSFEPGEYVKTCEYDSLSWVKKQDE